MTGQEMIFDARVFQPRYRHALIFSILEGLQADASFYVVNDHDPIPLREQFKSLAVPDWSWEYVESGPNVWKIKLSKGGAKEETECCGVCGGDKHSNLD